MTLFEYIVAACVGMVAFVQVWDWIEFRISLREVDREEAP